MAMMNPTMRKQAFPIASSITLLVCLPLIALADSPPGYYNSVDTTDSTTLRTTLHEVIDDHERIRY